MYWPGEGEAGTSAEDIDNKEHTPLVVWGMWGWVGGPEFGEGVCGGLPE